MSLMPSSILPSTRAPLLKQLNAKSFIPKLMMVWRRIGLEKPCSAILLIQTSNKLNG